MTTVIIGWRTILAIATLDDTEAHLAALGPLTAALAADAGRLEAAGISA